MVARRLLHEKLRTVAWGVALLVSGCGHKTDGPTPSLTSPLMPQAACNEQVSSVVLVSGDMLSPLNDHTLLDKSRIDLPQLTLVRAQDITGMGVDSTSATNILDVPNDPDHPEAGDEAWTTQKAMSFGICPPNTCSKMMPVTPPLLSDWALDPATYPGGLIPTGLYSLKVKNRAQETTATLANAIAIVPVPVLDRVDADLLCKDKDNTATLTGDFFLIVNGQKPHVRLSDDQGFDKTLDPSMIALADMDCRNLPAPDGFSLKACKKITVTIPTGTVTFKNPTDTFRNLKVTVTGPDPVGCHSTSDVEITFVPEPNLVKVVPDILCDAEGDRMIQLQGNYFLTVDGKVPGIGFDAMTMAGNATAADCTMVGRTGYPREVVQSCKTLNETITKGMLPPVMPGAAPINYSLVVTNPAPANCSSKPPVDLTVAPQPLVATIAPDLTCEAQSATTYTITGKGFLGIDALLPTVTFTDSGGKMVTATPTFDPMSCTAMAGPTEKLQVCGVLKVSLEKGALSPGVAQMTVTNPATAGCTSATATMLVVPPPVVTSVKPAAICTAQGDVVFTVTGSNFISIDGAQPTVTFNDGKATVTATNAMVGGCVKCVAAADCLKGQQCNMGACTGGFTTEKALSEGCTTVQVTVPKGSLNTMMPVTYKVAVQNPLPAGCTSQENITVVSAPPPVINTVSPATLCAGGGKVTLGGMNFEMGATVSIGPLNSMGVTVSNGGTSAAVNVGGGLQPGTYDVAIANPSGCSAVKAKAISVVPGLTVFFADPPTVWNGISTQITIYGANVSPPIAAVLLQQSGTMNPPINLPFVTDPQHPNRARATVPVGTAAGTYDVLVIDQTCQAVLPMGLKVVANTNFMITSITPKYGYTGANTSVTIRSGASFVPTPRAYLSPVGGGLATALSGVAFVDASTLTAVVPQGTPVGVYDLIIVNPDGTVGVLKSAFTEIKNPVPLIITVNPAAISSGQTFTVEGQNFDKTVTMTFDCFDVAGASVGPAAGYSTGAPVGCGPDQCVQISGGVFPGAYCIVTATNADMSAGQYFAIVLQNPSLKTGPFTPATSMITSRRALGLATAQVTASARYIYAVGGDSGVETGALDSVEAAPVDIFGKIGSWFTLPNRLSSKRTFVSAINIGRFIYAVGGSNGSSALNSVERAYVLNPSDATQFTDLNIDLPPQGQMGVPSGTFYYRVAPVMAANDAFNPGGENLPSDPFVILAPNLNNGAYLTLTWAAVPGAASYRIYRSPTANLGAGTEVLIAQGVIGTSYTDKFAPPLLVNNQQVKPLPIGATGVWSTQGLLPLKAARSGAAVTTVTDTKNASIHYLYALGGNSGTEAGPVPLNSTEYLSITVNNDSSQNELGDNAGPNLAVSRWQSAGFSQVLNGVPYVWAFGGLPGPTSVEEGSAIGNGGLPGAWQLLASNPGARAGLIALAATNEIVVWGGLNAAPDASGRHGAITAPPQVQNFNNLPNALTSARYLMGYTLQSSEIIVCGGSTNTPASNTCEYTTF